jgi:cell wall-associated NlpC family hydrolase
VLKGLGQHADESVHNARIMLRRCWVLGVLALLAACAGPVRYAPVENANVPSKAPRASAAQPPQAIQESPGQRPDVVLMAVAMLDRNYTYGGKKLHTGFDCSGFVSFVYREAMGIQFNGNAAQQAQQSQPIEAREAQPGDLVFFNTTGRPNSHVGIYVGKGKFVHAENERTGVKTSSLNQRYWSRRFEGFRRVNQ